MKKAALYIAFALLLLLLAGLVLRGPLLRRVLNSRVEQFNERYHARLAVGSASFKGISTLFLKEISLAPESGDTLLRIDTLEAAINPWKLITGRVSIVTLDLRRMSVTMMRQDTLTNYMFLAGSGGAKQPADTLAIDTAGAGIRVSYARLADRMARLLFDIIPHEITISGFELSTRADGHYVAFRVERFALEGHYFRTPVEVFEDTLMQRWMVNGRVDNHQRQLAFRLVSADTIPVAIPYIGFRWNAAVQFDTLAFSVAEREGEEERTQVTGYLKVHGLSTFHQRISAEPVCFDRLSFDYVVNAGSDHVEIDSSSTVTINHLDFHPYVRYRPLPSKQLTIAVHRIPFPAQDLFSSLPAGLFGTLQGVEARGNLSWYFDLFVDLARPDSLLFSTDLRRHQFSVASYGNAQLTRFNEPFLYTAYEQGRAVRTFEVGPSNPAYRRLDQISPHLKAAVMTSEDGGFYQHRGFLADAFRESIITNIKERRFARGGSTISMQLVKNLFLSRNKTIARKLEELLIVWLIENQGLSTKERMFEVYLNIIEWGPLVYGAGEAAQFYFAKDVSRLTLAEAIFMASVIPRPKWFRYAFDESGHLRPSMEGYYRLVSEKMVGKGWIGPRDAEQLVPDVTLRGAARMLLKQTDTIAADTLAAD